MLHILTKKETEQGLYLESLQQITGKEDVLRGYIADIWMGYKSVEDWVYTACIEDLEGKSPLVQGEKPVKILREVNQGTSDYVQSKLPEGTESITLLLRPKGVNVVLTYKEGNLVGAKTYGRGMGGVDITEAVQRVLGYQNDSLLHIKETKIQGVLLIQDADLDPIQNYCNVHEVYGGVHTLLSMEDAPEVYEYVTFVATDIEAEGLPYTSMEQKLVFLEALGFVISEIQFLELAEYEELFDALYFGVVNLEDLELGYAIDGIHVTEIKEEVVLYRPEYWEETVYTRKVKSLLWKEQDGLIKPIVTLDEPVPQAEYRITEVYLQGPYEVITKGVVEGKEIKVTYIAGEGLKIVE